MTGFAFMPIIPYDDFQGRLARERSNGDIVDYELGEDGVYRPVQNLPTTRPTGRPVPQRNPGLGVVGAAVDAVCLARSIAPNQFLRNLVSASPFDVIPGVRNARERAFNFLCDETPNSQVPVENTPFQGGQCDAVLYSVTGVVTRYSFQDNQCNESLQNYDAGNFWGPILGVRPYRISSGQWGLVVTCRGQGNQTIQPGFVQVERLAISSSSLCPPPLFQISVQRADGLPDDCGNPVPQPITNDREQLPPNLSLDINFEDGTVNVPIDVSFNPEIGIQIDVGDISINFDGENIEYTEPNDPNVGDDDIPPLIPPDDEECPTRPKPDETAPDPDDPPPPPPPGEEYEEPPEQPSQVIRGVLVTVEQSSPALTVVAGEGIDPDNYFPDVGTVKFRCRVDVGDSGFTNPIRVQGLRTFVPCPWEGGAFEVVGTPRPGVEWRLTPVFDFAIT